MRRIFKINDDNALRSGPKCWRIYSSFDDDVWEEMTDSVKDYPPRPYYYHNGYKMVEAPPRRTSTKLLSPPFTSIHKARRYVVAIRKALQREDAAKRRKVERVPLKKPEGLRSMFSEVLVGDVNREEAR